MNKLQALEPRVLEILGASLEAALKRAHAEVSDLLTNARDARRQRYFKECSYMLRQQAGVVANTFRKRLKEAIEHPPENKPAHALSLSLDSGMGIVSDAERQDQFMADELGKRIAAAVTQETFLLGRLIFNLTESRECSIGRISLDTRYLADFVVLAIRVQGCELEVRKLLAEVLENTLPEQFQLGFRGLAKLLTDLRDGNGEAAQAEAAPAAPPEPAPIQTPLDTAAPLPSTSNTPAEPSVDAAAAPKPKTNTAKVKEFLILLDRLQQREAQGNYVENPDNFGEDGTPVNLCKRLIAGDQLAELGERANISLPKIAATFEVLFTSRDISRAMKAALCGLQLPLMKVALLARRSLPIEETSAFKLFVALIEAARLAGPDVHRTAPLCALTEATVSHVLSEFADKLEVFTEALSAFNGNKSNLPNADGVPATSSSRPMDNATARKLLEPMLRPHGLPDGTVELLHQHAELLIVASRHANFIDGLLSGLSPASWQKDRNSTMLALPRQLAQLQKGLSAAQLDGPAAAPLLLGLTKIQAGLMRSALVPARA